MAVGFIQIAKELFRQTIVGFRKWVFLFIGCQNAVEWQDCLVCELRHSTVKDVKFRFAGQLP